MAVQKRMTTGTEMDPLLKLLLSAGLDHFRKPFHEVGIDSVADAEALSDANLTALGLKKGHILKFRRSVATKVIESASSTPALETSSLLVQGRSDVEIHGTASTRTASYGAVAYTPLEVELPRTEATTTMSKYYRWPFWLLAATLAAVCSAEGYLVYCFKKASSSGQGPVVNATRSRQVEDRHHPKKSRKHHHKNNQNTLPVAQPTALPASSDAAVEASTAPPLSNGAMLAPSLDSIPFAKAPPHPLSPDLSAWSSAVPGPPYPTGAWFLNAMLGGIGGEQAGVDISTSTGSDGSDTTSSTDDDECAKSFPVAPLPYAVKMCAKSGLQVSYGHDRQQASRLSVSDVFAPDWTFQAYQTRSTVHESSQEGYETVPSALQPTLRPFLKAHSALTSTFRYAFDTVTTTSGSGSSSSSGSSDGNVLDFPLARGSPYMTGIYRGSSVLPLLTTTWAVQSVVLGIIPHSNAASQSTEPSERATTSTVAREMSSVPFFKASAPSSSSSSSSSCAANPACAALHLEGLCCPTAAGVMLGCCDNSADTSSSSSGAASAPSPSSTSPPISPTPKPASSLSSSSSTSPSSHSSCEANPACGALGLKGLCCPTGAGVLLGCCGSGNGDTSGTDQSGDSSGAATASLTGESFLVTLTNGQKWALFASQIGGQSPMLHWNAKHVWLAPHPASSTNSGADDGSEDKSTQSDAAARVVVRLARLADPSLAIPSDFSESSPSSTSSDGDNSDSGSSTTTASSVATTAEAEIAAWAALWAHRQAVPINGDVQWSVRNSGGAVTGSDQGNGGEIDGSADGASRYTSNRGAGAIDSGVGRLTYVWTTEPLNSASSPKATSPHSPTPTPLLMLALPHHQDALRTAATNAATTSSDGDSSSSSTSNTQAVPSVALACVKGYMVAHVGHVWALQWHLPRIGSDSVFEATQPLNEKIAEATSSRFPYGDDGADPNAVDNVRKEEMSWFHLWL